MQANPLRRIVVASPDQGKGKSTTSANLGMVLANAGKRTLILDCDFRNSSIHEFFGIHNARGMVDVLARTYRLQEIWQEPVKGLKVVPTGLIPPNPEEVLNTEILSEFLASVRKDFDYILINSPSIGLLSDPSILLTQGDGVLLVLDVQKTPKRSVVGSGLQVWHGLQAAGTNLLETVTSKINASPWSSVSCGHLLWNRSTFPLKAWSPP
ncbi:MAG: CpsD/CapB family tyrosine-protein kinase [Actinobacteria bacterium]|nr:CpsD/CapB family tyrosine-protein kinase [Actinomycetota bacterium]